MCFKQRKKPAISVGILSGLVVIVGCLMAFLSIRFSDAEVFNLGDESKNQKQDGINQISDFKNTAFYLLITASIASIFIGICGVSLMCVKARGCAVMYGCFLLPAWIILFVFGVLIAIFSNSSKTTIESFCDNVDMQSDYIDSLRSFVGNVDDLIGDLVSKKMCSEVCPCEDTAAKQAWLNLEEAQLNTYSRTLNKFSTLGYETLIFGGSGAKEYKTFEDCFKDIRAGNTSEPQSEVQKYDEQL